MNIYRGVAGQMLIVPVMGPGLQVGAGSDIRTRWRDPDARDCHYRPSANRRAIEPGSATREVIPLIYPLRPDDTALLVIDAQEEYFDPGGPAYVAEAAQRLPNINRLIESCSDLRAPVVYVRHAHRASGADVGRMGDFASEGEEDAFIEGSPRVAFHSGLITLDDPIIVTKNRYDSFLGTDLDGVLRTLGVGTVVVAGYMTSFCCDTTARTAHGRDYRTVFVADAVGGPDLVRTDGSLYPSAEVLEDVCAALAAGFAEVLDSDEVIARMNGG